MSDAYDGPVPSPWPEDDPAARLLALVRSGDWLDAQEFPPLRWAVHGLIPEGFGLFTGPPKAGKSWCALGLALSVAAGGHALGKVPTGDPRPVLYLALEDGYARLQWRARQLLGDEVSIPPLLHTVTRATPGDVLPLIRAWLDQHRGTAPLVLLDTLGKVMPQSLPGESAYQRDYRIGGHIKAIADDYRGVTVLVVHHTRKATGEDWMDSTSGTNGLNGAADFTLNLSRSRNENSGVLRVTGRDVSEAEYAITSQDGSWTLDGSTLADAAAAAVTARAVADLGDRSAEIVRFITQHPEGVSPSAVSKAFEMTGANAGTYLGRLVESGRLAKVTRGLYRGVESVESVESGLSVSTLSTHSTAPLGGVPTPCTVCGEALTPVDGSTTHPNCEGVPA